MSLKTKIWFKALIASIVTGGTSSGLSAFGTAAASGLGVDVAKIDLKQFGIILLSGAIVGALAYLKQSPVPPDSTGNTDIITK